MAYIKQTWQNNPPSTATPISAARLNHLETQYDEAIAQVAADIADPDSDIGTELSTTIEDSRAVLDDLFTPLDIWPAFYERNQGALSWDASTYSNWITGVHEAIGPHATREQIGTAVGGAPIYAYTAGPENAPHVLLVGGTHGIEIKPQYVTMRFFQSFCDPTDATMKKLASRVRLTWVPTLSAGAYASSRKNQNEVDPNRNFAFYWPWYDDSNPDNSKGSAAFSEPESAAIKYLCDTYQIGAVIDCHTLGSSDPYFQHAGPSTMVAGNRRTAFAADSAWAELYNTDGLSHSELGSGIAIDPTMKSWAAKYLRWDKGRQNAFAVTLEARNSAAFSGVGTNVTPREFMRLYCGYIHMVIATWLRDGQQSSDVTTASWSGKTTSYAPTVAVQDGGSLLSSQSEHPINLQFVDDITRNRAYIDVPVRCRGQFVISATVDFEGDAANTAPVQVGVRPSHVGTPELGSTGTEGVNGPLITGQVPAGGRQSVTATWTVVLGNTWIGTPVRVRVYLRRWGAHGATSSVTVRGVNVSVIHTPKTDVDNAAAINL